MSAGIVLKHQGLQFERIWDLIPQLVDPGTNKGHNCTTYYTKNCDTTDNCQPILSTITQLSWLRNFHKVIQDND